MEKKERERQCVTQESSIRTKCLECVVYVHIFTGVVKVFTARGCHCELMSSVVILIKQFKHASLQNKFLLLWKFM